MRATRRTPLPASSRILAIGAILVLGGLALAGVATIDDTPELATLIPVAGTLQKIEHIHLRRTSPFVRLTLLDDQGQALWLQLPELSGAFPSLSTLQPGQRIRALGKAPESALGRPILWAWELSRGPEELIPYPRRVELHRQADRRTIQLGEGMAALGFLCLLLARWRVRRERAAAGPLLGG